MKKTAVLLLSLVVLLAFVSCGVPPKEAEVLGINAVIAQIDNEHKTITVEQDDTEGFFKEETTLDCSGVPVFYCNYKTEEVKSLSLEDLKIGDEILLNIRKSELATLHNGGEGLLKVEQIQLGTQRLN